MKGVLLIGPQGIGKTTHAKELAELLGCRAIIDDEECAAVPYDTLVLGSAASASQLHTCGVLIQVNDESGLEELLMRLKHESHQASIESAR